MRAGIVVNVTVDLQLAINRFVADTNADPKPFVWTADPKPSSQPLSAGTKRWRPPEAPLRP